MDINTYLTKFERRITQFVDNQVFTRLEIQKLWFKMRVSENRSDNSTVFNAVKELDVTKSEVGLQGFMNIVSSEIVRKYLGLVSLDDVQFVNKTQISDASSCFGSSTASSSSSTNSVTGNIESNNVSTKPRGETWVCRG